MRSPDRTPTGDEDSTMTRGAIETFYADGRWRNRIHTVHELPQVHDTREEAAAVGRRLARSAGVDHIVRDTDGTIVQREPYDHDPHNLSE
jgi:hypothetical protein